MYDISTIHGIPRPINRSKIYADVMETYEENVLEVIREFPFRIRFEGEKAVDTGGVCRDMYSSFWETAYTKHFDGETLLVPAVHPNTKLSTFPILGTVISHGFLVSGFIPVRIAFPVLAHVFFGTDVVIPDAILLESFIDYLSSHDSSVVREAVLLSCQKEVSFSSDMQTQLINLLSHLGCREIPTPINIKRLLFDTFIIKPLGTLFTLRSGVPTVYHKFWTQFSLEEFFELYKYSNATSASVLKNVNEPEAMNAAETRVFRYLLTFIGNAKQKQLRLFLRYVTGSSVLMISNPITVGFNNLTGLGRRPISHTCNCTLELSISYATYPEFEEELSNILQSDMAWVMDAM